MSSFFFSTPVDIDIVLEDSDERETVDTRQHDKSRREKAPLYMDGESVKGAVTVRPKDGKRLEHTGIKVQFIGMIGTHSAPCFSVRPLSTARLLILIAASDNQKCSTIEATITNSSPLAKNSPPRASCNTPRPIPSISKTSRSSTNPTMASTSNYAILYESPSRAA